MGCRLANVEEDPEAASRIRMDNGHAQGGASQMPHPFTALEELLEGGFLGKRLVCEFAHGALVADGVVDA